MEGRNATKAKLMLDWLKAFNRKERYHLLRTAITGADRDVPLADDFRECLEKVLGPDIQITNAYVAIDYHLDWLAAAKYLAEQEIPVEKEACGKHFPNENAGILKGNQEDTDLLVAFCKGDKLILILVEAKADTAWSAQQLDSKAKRLKAIFGNNMDDNFFKCHFVLLGPKRENINDEGKTDLDWRYQESIRPDGVGLDDWPDWFGTSVKSARTFRYIEMYPDESLYYPTRLNSNSTEWKVEQVTTFKNKD